MLAGIVRKPGVTAATKLREYAFASFAYTYEEMQSPAKLNELVETVSSRNPELVHRQIHVICSQLAEILALGNSTGEFDCDDVIVSAEYVFSALTAFQVPLLMHLYPREDYERRLGGVLDLLLIGLLKR